MRIGPVPHGIMLGHSLILTRPQRRRFAPGSSDRHSCRVIEKETETDSEENKGPLSDLLFDSAALYLRFDTDARFKHQGLSYHSRERAQA
jgi:hypothetical protein